MLVMVACANGLRTIARCSIPGRVMLSVQRVRPVISRSSSLRLPVATDLGGRGVLYGGHHCLLSAEPLRGVLHGL